MDQIIIFKVKTNHLSYTSFMWKLHIRRHNKRRKECWLTPIAKQTTRSHWWVSTKSTIDVVHPKTMPNLDTYTHTLNCYSLPTKRWGPKLENNTSKAVASTVKASPWGVLFTRGRNLIGEYNAIISHDTSTKVSGRMCAPSLLNHRVKFYPKVDTRPCSFLFANTQMICVSFHW